MKLLIAGAHGQLGIELTRLSGSHDVLATDHAELDITDYDAVISCVEGFQPDVVINAAAYTAVDQAESDVEAAFAVNRDGPANLAQACALMQIPLIHVSTDYVFDGSKQGGYVEGDVVAPLGVYGTSKLAGELAVQQHCSRYLILRTSWVFSAHGNNFVKTMLRLGVEREELGVVSDQYGKPTSAAELARVILAILPKMQGGWGIYHMAQPDATSWHGFAKTIFIEAEKQGVDLQLKTLKAITTADYPTPTKRPENSDLACDKIEQTFGVTIKPWQQSLSQVIKELAEKCTISGNEGFTNE